MAKLIYFVEEKGKYPEVFELRDENKIPIIVSNNRNRILSISRRRTFASDNALEAIKIRREINDEKN